MDDIKDERLALKPIRAAKMLDVSRSNIYKLIGSGEIHAIRFGGVWRIPLAEIQRLLNADEARDASR